MLNDKEHGIKRLQMKKYIELFTGISKLVVGCCIAIGTIVILLYCMGINFYPKGIEIGDGLFFIWTALAFGARLIFTVLFFSAIGLSLYSALVSLITLCLSFIISNYQTKLPKVQNSTIWPLHVATIIVLALYFLMSISVWLDKSSDLEIDYMYWFQLFTALLANGFIAAGLLTINDRQNAGDENEDLDENFPVFDSEVKKRKKITMYIVGCLLFYIPLLSIDGFGERVLNRSIVNLGIKKDHVSLYLNQMSSSFVSNLIKKGNYDFFLVPVGNGSYRLDEATVLFQGIGNVSHIRLRSSSGELTFDLPSDSFVVSKESKVRARGELADLVLESLPQVMKRHEIKFNPDTYMITFSDKYSAFNINSTELSSSFKSVLNESMPHILDFLNQHQELIERIEVVGYSSDEWKASDSKVDAYIKNHELAVARSTSFIRHLYNTESILSRMSLMINLINIKGVSSNDSSRVNSRTVELKIVPRVKKSNSLELKNI
ncbi:hypothetical protein [Pseudoalteromonas sp. NCIMB_1079]|uniref:hypothetical protein n=1 Tax=Pseudoalteromonas sp. NCIMB 1079 TaxID=3142847 RepID=UPI00339C02CC